MLKSDRMQECEIVSTVAVCSVKNIASLQLFLLLRNDLIRTIMTRPAIRRAHMMCWERLSSAIHWIDSGWCYFAWNNFFHVRNYNGIRLMRQTDESDLFSIRFGSSSSTIRLSFSLSNSRNLSLDLLYRSSTMTYSLLILVSAPGDNRRSANLLSHASSRNLAT